VYNDNVNTGPNGVAFDSEGNVYFSQGTGGCEGIAVDKSGNVYVSNSTLNDITVYNSSGTLINTLTP
jgi:sugar lactone lactonase YvrE